MLEQTKPSSKVSPLTLVDLMGGFILSRAMYVAVKLGIADHLRDGPKSTAELAEATGTHEPSLYRLLRVLASAAIFSEIETQKFAHTPLSQFLISAVPGSVRALILMWGSDWEWKIWGELAYSVETGEPAFDHLFGMDLWRYFSQVDPEAGSIFNQAMTDYSATLNGAIVAAYEEGFSSLGAGTIVDVGGGEGSLLSLLLSRHPQLHGILFDRQVLEAARERFAADGLEERCELVSGDFFEAVPPGNAFVLKDVLHDWDDELCVKILLNIRKACSAGDVVLVVALLIPEGNQPAFSKLLDLQMMIEFRGGRERTEREFRKLFSRAGFELARVIPTSSEHSIIEGRAV